MTTHATRASRWRHLLPVTAGVIALTYVLVWLTAVALAQSLDAGGRADSRPITVSTIAALAAVPEPEREPGRQVGATETGVVDTGGSTVEPSPSSSSIEPTTTSTVPASARTPSVGPPPSPSDYAFLDCVRWRESRGHYRALNPSGAAGAYQLMPDTARQIALRAGRHDLAVQPVTEWSPADQDLLALLLYRWQGAAPWGGGCWRGA